MTKKEVALSTGATIEDFSTAIVTEWGFDKNDNLDSHKDDSANETTWAHDDLDRVITMTYPDASDVDYEYDDADNVTEITDAAGNVLADTYNAGNQRTSRTVTRGTGVLDTTSESWTYDGMGRMTKAEDNDYKVEFTYAVQGLRSMVYEEKQSNVGMTAYTKTVKKTYDVMGRKETELYESGTDLDYTWNDISRLSTVGDGTNTIATYTYVGSRVKEVEFQNGATATYTYTGFRNEVERIHHETSTPATIVDLQYAYDDNHDRLYERFGGTSASGDAFEYDWARRLDVAWMGSATPASPSSAAYTKKIEYTLDDNGNRSSVKVTPYGQSATTTSYTDNNLNQYTDIGGTTHDYDDNGNLKDDGTYTYEYNFRNLLCRVKDKGSGDTVATYRHDALGRRVKKLVDSVCTRFIYSGAETVAVYDDATTLLQEYVYGQVIDEVLMLEQADVLDFDDDANTTELTRSFYHRNALGSVMEITEMDEDVAVSYRYDPYGAVTIMRNSSEESEDPLGQPIMYTGRWRDEETGLMHYRARAYRPTTGRFPQRDPNGTGEGPNLYEYTRSAPTLFIDPAGKSFLIPLVAPDIAEAFKDLVDDYLDWLRRRREARRAARAVAEARAKKCYLASYGVEKKCYCKCVVTVIFSNGSSKTLGLAPVASKSPEERRSPCICSKDSDCEERCDKYAAEKKSAHNNMVANRGEETSYPVPVPSNLRKRHSIPRSYKDDPGDYDVVDVPLIKVVDTQVVPTCDFAEAD